MFKNCAIALSFLLPTFALASNEIDMSCGQTVKAFFEPLVQRRLIGTKPMSVEQSTSINHFSPIVFANITAYGMPVRSVFGYTNEPLFFTNTGGNTREVYGVIVKEGIANVQAQLRSAGVENAQTFRADGRSTIILCNGE